MALQAITLSSDPALSCGAPAPAGTSAACAFCGAPAGLWAQHGYAASNTRAAAVACPLCSLPQHLERPRIDEEAALIWLPEMSQPALNATLREIHLTLQALGEDVHADAVFRTRTPALANLYYARAVLAERRAAAEDRAGTASPRELGLALQDLPPADYARRAALLDGLRLLPLGRFFDGDADVYPEIVGFWRDAAAPNRPNGAR